MLKRQPKSFFGVFNHIQMLINCPIFLKKKFFLTQSLILVFLFLFQGNEALAQFWMQNAGGATIDEAYDVSVDPSGNAYSVGYFTSSASFGSTSLIANGSTDIFVSKNNNTGGFSWAVKAGGSGADRGTAIATDAAGNVYVTGYYNGTANFGSSSLTSNGLQDIFIAKYNTSGVLAWVKSAGSSESDFGFGIAVNSTGDVFVTGSFKGSATFGSTVVTAANTTSDVFITKLNSLGVFQWTKTGTGNYANLGRSVGCDNSGNVYFTGQYSDTITFDTQHNNQMQNIIFVVKYNASGTEQWFARVGGAVSNVVNDIAVDNIGGCYLTGDNDGALTYYNTNSSIFATTPTSYTNNFFIAKINSAGAWQLTGGGGSDNPVSSQSVAYNSSGDVLIGGHYECVLSSFSAITGAATFNAVGNKDVFVARFSVSTAFWAQSAGGRGDDYCSGIGVNTAGEIFAVGSFDGSFHVPVSTNFLAANLGLWTPSSCGISSTYCGDPSYSDFYSMSAAGNKDAFMLNSFDYSREPYDFFKRSGSGCVKDLIPVCIDTSCADTLTACGSVTLNAITSVCTALGPSVNYDWSTGVSGPSLSVSVSGMYFVTETSSDGCFSSVDSIYALVLPAPPVPVISDDKLVNTNDTVTTEINLCPPDTVQITAGGFDASLTYSWTGPGLGAGVFDSVINVSVTGTFVFTVIGANGCESVNQVLVRNNVALPPFDLEMKLPDTVLLCTPDPFTAQLYDSVTNSGALPLCMATSAFLVLTAWTVTPACAFTTSCDTYGFFTPTTSGTYTVSATTVRFNNCYSDTFTVSKSVYVDVSPSPVIPPFIVTISGNSSICPGGTVELTASGGPNYSWVGFGIFGSTDSVVTVSAPGNYLVVSSAYDTNSFGCTAELVVNTQIQITPKQQPIIVASSTVICPNDSVLLFCTQSIGNNWEGPNGPIPGGGSIYVTDPGQYFTVVNDADSCGLVSNTITLFQYTTPELVASGDTFICVGDSTIISVQATNNSTVDWQPPLSGSSLSQVIYTAGTYTCKITSCGIETTASITIHSGSSQASIIGDSVLCADSTIILSGAAGLSSYLWMPGNLTTPSITVGSGGTYVLTIIDSNGCTGSDTLVVTEITVSASISTVAQGFCPGDSITLTGNPGMKSYLWSPTNDTSQNIVTYQAGSFSLLVTDSSGCQASAGPIEITVADSVALATQTGNNLICEGESVLLTADNTGFASYNWQPGNVSSPNLTVTESGTYILTTVDSIGCIAQSDSFVVEVQKNNLLVTMISNDTTVCEGAEIILVADGGADSVIWYSPLGDPAIGGGDSLVVTVNETSTYYVQVESPPCYSDYASVVIVTEDCRNPEIGNVFTPNGDGSNDYFQIRIPGATCFNVEIYNRWGVLIYTLISQEQSWDGRIYNSPAEAADGVYYYVLNYCTIEGEDIGKSGYITLIR